MTDPKTPAEKITIELGDLTLEEFEEVETLSGRTIGEFTGGTFTAKATRALVFITQRRSNPSFSWEDAGKIRLMRDVQFGTETTDADPNGDGAEPGA